MPVFLIDTNSFILELLRYSLYPQITVINEKKSCDPWARGCSLGSPLTDGGDIFLLEGWNLLFGKSRSYCWGSARPGGQESIAGLPLLIPRAQFKPYTSGPFYTKHSHYLFFLIHFIAYSVPICLSLL